MTENKNITPITFYCELKNTFKITERGVKKSTPLQTKSDRKLASSDFNNDGGLEEKSESNQDLEVDSSLNRLEETEKKLKYHIRELESFLGLS